MSIDITLTDDDCKWDEQCRDQTIKTLRSNICEVIFIKKDGSERKMKCTLLGEHIPVETQPKPDSEKPRNYSNPQDPNIIRVYEIDNGWRSFDFTRMKSITTAIKD